MAAQLGGEVSTKEEEDNYYLKEDFGFQYTEDEVTVYNFLIENINWSYYEQFHRFEEFVDSYLEKRNG